MEETTVKNILLVTICFDVVEEYKYDERRKENRCKEWY